jgi:hypothetical protein
MKRQKYHYTILVVNDTNEFVATMIFQGELDFFNLGSMPIT